MNLNKIKFMLSVTFFIIGLLTAFLTYNLWEVTNKSKNLSFGSHPQSSVIERPFSDRSIIEGQVQTRQTQTRQTQTRQTQTRQVSKRPIIKRRGAVITRPGYEYNSIPRKNNNLSNSGVVVILGIISGLSFLSSALLLNSLKK